LTERERAALERLTAYMKKRFPNLTVEETLKIALDVMEIVAGYHDQGNHG
jgi:hypothetical protein